MNLFNHQRNRASARLSAGSDPATPTDTVDVKAADRPRIFYGWWIAIAGSFGMAMSAGVNFHGFGTFFLPLAREFGWSRTVISSVISLSRLEAGFLGPIEGFLVDRLGPRRLMLVGVPLMGLGYVLLSRINSLLAFYLVYIFAITLGSSIGMGTPMTAAVANWFNKKRGVAFGIMWMGIGFGGAFVPLLGWLVDSLGWRTAALIVGIMMWCLGIPIAFIMRHKPEPYGYLPDGEAPDRSQGGEEEADQSPPSLAADTSQDFTAREALRTPSFWFLAIGNSLRAVVSGGLGLHLIPFFEDMGVSPVSAAALAGSVGLMSIPGRFGLSTFGDYFNRRYIMAGCLAVMSVSILAISQANSIGQVVPGLVAYAVSFGGLSVIPFSLRAEYFGRSAYATIQGYMSSVQMIGMIAGPIFAGWIFDTTGSYENAFIGFGAACFLAVLFVLAATPPRRPTSARATAPGTRLR